MGRMLSRSCFGKATGPAIERKIRDIDCTTEIIERRRHRITIKQTDQGREIKRHIQVLTAVHKAYRDDSIVLKFKIFKQIFAVGQVDAVEI